MRLALALLLLSAAACEETTTTAVAETRAATLSGAEEVPPVVTTATGTASAVINAEKTSIAVTVTTTTFATPITMAHIHKGAVGVAGAVIFDLSTTAFTSPLTKTLTAADVKAGQGTFAEAIDAILAGGTYVNVHTMANGGGEIRGQLLKQ